MKISVQVVIEANGDAPPVVHEVTQLEGDALQSDALGLKLPEAKSLLQATQRVLVGEQVQAKFAGLVPCGLSAKLLAEVLPLGRTVHATAVRQHVQATAQQLEDELGPEQAMFINGCQRDWEGVRHGFTFAPSPWAG